MAISLNEGCANASIGLSSLTCKVTSDHRALPGYSTPPTDHCHPLVATSSDKTSKGLSRSRGGIEPSRVSAPTSSFQSIQTDSYWGLQHEGDPSRSFNVWLGEPEGECLSAIHEIVAAIREEFGSSNGESDAQGLPRTSLHDVQDSPNDENAAQGHPDMATSRDKATKRLSRSRGGIEPSRVSAPTSSFQSIQTDSYWGDPSRFFVRSIWLGEPGSESPSAMEEIAAAIRKEFGRPDTATSSDKATNGLSRRRGGKEPSRVSAPTSSSQSIQTDSYWGLQHEGVMYDDGRAAWCSDHACSDAELLKYKSLLLDAVRSCYKDGFLPCLHTVARKIEISLGYPRSARGSTLQMIQWIAQHMQDDVYLDRVGSFRHRPSVCVLLHVTPDGFKGFIDVSSSFDPYDEPFWNRFRNTMATLRKSPDWPTYHQNNHRLAKFIQESLQEFGPEMYSLAEVARICRLAVRRRILGVTRQTGMVLFEESHAFAANEKDFIARGEAMISFMDDDMDDLHYDGDQVISSWPELENALVVVLNLRHPNPKQSQHPKQRQGLSTSMVKRLIWQHLKKTLCAATLGHAKLSDVLTDARLAHLIHVEWSDNGGNDGRVFLRPLSASKPIADPLPAKAGSESSG